MQMILRVVVPSLLALLVWISVVIFGTVQGWWRDSLAPPGDTPAFLEAVSTELDASGAGNAVLVLLEDGEVVGRHQLSIGEPVDADSVFQVASLSKWVSAWGVLRLVEEGRLELDAPVSGYLTRWSLPESEYDLDGVTVRRLLSHTAGLGDGLGYAGFPPGTPVQSIEDSLTHAADAMRGASGSVRVDEPPGSSWRYSGGGFTLLQLLVEERSGEPFARFMQREVLEPLGMEHSSFVWPPNADPEAAAAGSGDRLVTFYDADGQPAPHYRYTALAAASLYTSASDLVRFLQAQLPGDDGAAPGRGVLSPGMLEEMRRPQGSRLGRDVYGLGTMLYAPDGSGGFVIGHDGNNRPAINTAARLDPATGDGIVLLETGRPLLASRLAGEWVFWETGNVGILTLVLDLQRSLGGLAWGGLVVVLASGFFSWQQWRQSSRRSQGAN